MKILAKRLPNTSYGTIAETGEKCIMQSNGYWVGAGGVRITSYHRVDKPDYNDKGEEMGTIDNPIEYNNNMILENGKYYTQDGIKYYCNRDTEIPVYNNLSALVGLYVVVANE